MSNKLKNNNIRDFSSLKSKKFYVGGTTGVNQVTEKSKKRNNTLTDIIMVNMHLCPSPSLLCLWKLVASR